MSYNRRMARRATGVLPVLALLVTAGSFVASTDTSLPDPGERWIEVRTAHFTLFSKASFNPYKKRVGLGPANVTGAFAGHRDGNYVALDASPATDPWSVVYHEYLHYFLNNNFEDI